MLMDQKALSELAARADEPEESRSAYWDCQVGHFTVATDGAMVGQNVHGNASKKVSA